MEYIYLLDLLEGQLECEQINIKNQYINLLSHLTSTYDLTLELFNANIKKIFKMGLIIVCITRTDEGIKLIGSGTILIEPKIIHGGRSVGHIEDVVVHPFYRGKGIAQTILNMLVEYSKEKCYKVILNCNPNMEQFYNKVGFDKKCIQMSLLHPLNH
jgi:glucosamine-phosphate N-acetyltransferase